MQKENQYTIQICIVFFCLYKGKRGQPLTRFFAKTMSEFLLVSNSATFGSFFKSTLQKTSLFLCADLLYKMEEWTMVQSFQTWKCMQLVISFYSQQFKEDTQKQGRSSSIGAKM